MGLLSKLFSRRSATFSHFELQHLNEYAQLAESIGIEEIACGVDAALLPADKTQLKETIAKVSLSSWTRIVLKPDDLVKLYGLLAFFFSCEELDIIHAARDIETNILNGAEVSALDHAMHTAGLDLISEAHEYLLEAKDALAVHADSLRS
jgi:hypothetical protein